MPTLHVVIPVFNEAETLATILDRVQAVPLPEPWHINITVVDDGSSPQFAAALEETVTDRSLDVIRHDQNQGKGAAIRAGLAAATGHYILFQDADLVWYKDPIEYVVEPQQKHESTTRNRRRDPYAIRHTPRTKNHTPLTQRTGSSERKLASAVLSSVHRTLPANILWHAGAAGDRIEGGFHADEARQTLGAAKARNDT